MGIVAIVPVAQMSAASAALTALSFGPVNFSAVAFSNGSPTHGCLHDWGTIPALVAAIKAQPGVVWNEGTGDPSTRLQALLSGVAQWGDRAPALPTSGNALANTLYSYNDEMWWCIQTFNRTTFNLPPSNYPALIRRSRRPGEVLPWVQPIDGNDAYFTRNKFTGQPDRVTHLGRQYRSTVTDPTPNVWVPGAVGSEALWADEGPAV